jgi:hypothetical protein
MLRACISSAFRDLKGERRILLGKVESALTSVGMEDFIPDGKTSQEMSSIRFKCCFQACSCQDYHGFIVF